MDKLQFENLVRDYIKEFSSPQQETIKKSELKAVIKECIRFILKECLHPQRKLSTIEEGQIPYEDLRSAWSEDRSGEYVQINPDDSVWYVTMGRAREEIAPKGTQNPFPAIARWMKDGGVVLNIWQVNDHGNVELYNRSGKPLGGLVESLKEITVTGDVSPINLPGSAIPSTGKSGWVSKKGGSKRGVEGSPTGMSLTPIGAEDMKRPQDPVYEQ